MFLCVADEASGRVLPYAFLTELSDVWVKLFKGEEPRESFTSFRAAIAQKMQKYSISGSDASSSEMAQLSSASSRGPLGLLPENGGQSGSNSPSTGPADPKAEKVRGIQRGLDVRINCARLAMRGMLTHAARAPCCWCMQEVKDVMASNIEKVMRRGEAIESLMDKSDNLSGSADRFRAQSTKLRKTLCWADFKVRSGSVVLLLPCLRAPGRCFIDDCCVACVLLR